MWLRRLQELSRLLAKKFPQMRNSEWAIRWWCTHTRAFHTGTGFDFSHNLACFDILYVTPCRYAEYITVPELQYLVKVPDLMPLSVAAMLPTGALWAMNTIQVAKGHIMRLLEQNVGGGNRNPCKEPQCIKLFFLTRMCFDWNFRQGEGVGGWHGRAGSLGSSISAALLAGCARQSSVDCGLPAWWRNNAGEGSSHVCPNLESQLEFATS